MLKIPSLFYGSSVDHVDTSCSACGSENRNAKNLVFTSSRGSEKSWSHCGHCGAFFCNDPFQVDQEVQHGTTASYGTLESGLKNAVNLQHLYNNILRLVQRYGTPACGSWLDLGCSFGGLLCLAKNAGYDVTGVDILPQAVDYIRSLGMAAYVVHSATQVPADEGFDVVTAIDSNYYWPDQRTEFSQIYQKLNPGGLFVVRTADKSWLVKLGLALQGLFPGLGKRAVAMALNDHRFSMPHASLLNLAVETGFWVESVDIRDAYYSEGSPFFVRAYFRISAILYKVSGLYIAPGYIVVLRKLKT